MELLPKPQITLLVDAETGREYVYIPYRQLPLCVGRLKGRGWEQSNSQCGNSNPGPEHDR